MSIQRTQYRPSSPFPRISQLAAKVRNNDHSSSYTFRETTRRRRTLLIDNLPRSLSIEDIHNLAAPCKILRIESRSFPSRSHLQSLQITFRDTHDAQKMMNFQLFGVTDYEERFPVIYNRINHFTPPLWNQRTSSLCWSWKVSINDDSKNQQFMKKDAAEKLYKQSRACEERIHYKKLKQKITKNRYNVPIVESASVSSSDVDDCHRHRDLVSPVDSLFQYYLDTTTANIEPATRYG